MNGPAHLLRINAPHFVAGLIIKNNVCVKAAPILKWTIGKDISFLRAYCAKRGWSIEVV